MFLTQTYKSVDDVKSSWNSYDLYAFKIYYKYITNTTSYDYT
jgi:hypothetical protein